ncbi:hypothetical protein ABZP36_009071 [Zizania latifolia]
MSSYTSVLCDVARIVRVTLGHVGQLFVLALNDLPLFFKTVLDLPPPSQLFGGIVDPVEETRLWKEHWDQLEATMVLLEPDIVARTCTDWLKECCDEILVERGSVPFDTVAEVEGHVHFFLSIPVKVSTDKTLVVDCLRCGMQIFVVNGALEYLAKDLGIAENAILQGGHPLLGDYIIHTCFNETCEEPKVRMNKVVRKNLRM